MVSLQSWASNPAGTLGSDLQEIWLRGSQAILVRGRCGTCGAQMTATYRGAKGAAPSSTATQLGRPKSGVLVVSDRGSSR